VSAEGLEPSTPMIKSHAVYPDASGVEHGAATLLASRGTPATSGIAIEMRPQGLHANSGSHQSRNNTQIAKPQRAANEKSESQRSTSFIVGAAS
jgi:hypothetical protein